MGDNFSPLHHNLFHQKEAEAEPEGENLMSREISREEK